jgi:hypothetical protein
VEYANFGMILIDVVQVGPAAGGGRRASGLGPGGSGSGLLGAAAAALLQRSPQPLAATATPNRGPGLKPLPTPASPRPHPPPQPDDKFQKSLEAGVCPLDNDSLEPLLRFDAGSVKDVIAGKRRSTNFTIDVESGGWVRGWGRGQGRRCSSRGHASMAREPAAAYAPTPTPLDTALLCSSSPPPPPGHPPSLQKYFLYFVNCAGEVAVSWTARMRAHSHPSPPPVSPTPPGSTSSTSSTARGRSPSPGPPASRCTTCGPTAGGTTCRSGRPSSARSTGGGEGGAA